MRAQIAFEGAGWIDYQYWTKTDKKTLSRINSIIKSIARTPFSGIGKPEALTGKYRGYWSRRINQEHRLVYRVEEDSIVIVQCRFHY